MGLVLIKGNYEYKDLIVEMVEEWQEFNNTHDTYRLPKSIFKYPLDDFSFYLDHLDNNNPSEGMVPSSTFFCLDEDNKILVGAVNIRHYLNEYFLSFVGHVGHGIRPSMRGKGYGNSIVRLAIQKCKSFGIDRVLMVCNKNNIASAKTIINNGGIMENEVYNNGELMQRYWINA